jgi:hypothetical protein
VIEKDKIVEELSSKGKEALDQAGDTVDYSIQ